MANIVVTITDNRIKIDFGNYAGTVLSSIKGNFCKNDVTLFLYSNFILAEIKGQKDWKVSHNGANGSLIIDSINGVAVSDLNDLYNKLNSAI